jgi:hypothetical protein
VRKLGLIARLGVAVGLLGAATIVGPAGAEEPASPAAPGQVLVELCGTSGLAGVPEVGPGLCTSVAAGSTLLAAVCQLVAVDPTACAALTDGKVVDPKAVDAFAAGWVPRALRLQARLSEDRPLRDDLIPHTHNSFNTPDYGPSVTTLDPNARYTLTDQLRMGIRAIELDVHWLPSPFGSLESGGYAVTVCHGDTQDVGGVRVHVGCTIDQPLAPRLQELSDYLRAPGNEHEFLLLYLQNELDGNAAGHAATVAQLDQHLGDLIYRPPAGQPAGQCADLPVELSRAQIMATGKRVLVTGNCGPGGWSSVVFQRGAGWNERGNSTPYPAFSDCAADRAARDYDHHWIRITEDTTWLSAITGSPAPITEPEVRAMVRCGVELIGLDRIGPNDPRLPDLVWSWAVDEPSTAGRCATWGDDARFRAADCSGSHRAACATADGGWVFTDRAVARPDAAAACQAEGATFEVPRSAWSNEQLRVVAAAAGEVTPLWLDVADGPDGWRPGAVQASDSGPLLPATGRPSLLPLGLAMLTLGAATRKIAHR